MYIFGALPGARGPDEESKPLILRWATCCCSCDTLKLVLLSIVNLEPDEALLQQHARASTSKQPQLLPCRRIAFNYIVQSNGDDPRIFCAGHMLPVHP